MSDNRKSDSGMSSPRDASSNDGGASAVYEQNDWKVEPSARSEINIWDKYFADETGVAVTKGTSENYTKDFIKNKHKISLDDGISNDYTIGQTTRQGLIENTSSKTIGLNINDNNFTLHHNQHISEKIGNDEISMENAADISNSISTDGTMTTSASTEQNIKVGDSEIGNKFSISGKSTDKEEEQTIRYETSSKVKIADGMKMKNSVGMEYSEKITEKEDGVEIEKSAGFVPKSRMEVEPDQSLGKKLAAHAYNKSMDGVEQKMKDSLSYKEKTEISYGNPKKEAAEQKQAEEEQEELLEAEQQKMKKEQEENDLQEENAENYDYYYGMGY